MEIVIRCLGCGCTLAQGGLAQDLSEAEVYQQAEHNPGCQIKRPNMLTVLHRDEQVGKVIYSLIVFPRHNEETAISQ